MFTAINSVTGALVNSVYLSVSHDYIRNEVWYAPTSSLDFVPSDIEKDKVIVKFREGSEDIINNKGTIYDISPHFYIPDAEKLGIKTKPISPEHIKCQNFIYNLVKEGQINILSSSLTISKNKLSNYMSISIEKIDFSKIDYVVTVNARNKIIADILFQFKEYDPIYGYGIIIEIQLTMQREKTELSRSFNRANKLYSVCWLKPNDFVDINANNLKLKEDYIEITDFVSILEKYKEML